MKEPERNFCERCTLALITGRVEAEKETELPELCMRCYGEIAEERRMEKELWGYLVTGAKLDEMRGWYEQVKACLSSISSAGIVPDTESMRQTMHACLVLGECLANGPEEMPGSPAEKI